MNAVKYPPSLFNEDGTMTAASTKASLVKILKKETKVTTADLYPQRDWKMAVVADAMHAIRRWSFKNNETFGDIVRYKKQQAKVFEVSEQYKNPDFHEFFSVSANKATLLDFLCET